MNQLIHYGWNQYSQLLNEETYNISELGRVLSIKGTKFILLTETGELESELTGKQLFSLSKEEQPKVGDWVTYIDYGSQAFILDVLPRKNMLFRKTPGNETGKQVIATNVDKAVIIQGLDHNFNIMRLERYIVQALACNILPIVILNKSDLISNKRHYENEVQKLQRNLPLYFCSTLTKEGIEILKKELFKAEYTYVFIGSSGVGKSSLLNVLFGSDLNTTGEISAATQKGKHTTTTRDLYKLPNGSLIIDTPGMREFGIGFNDETARENAFPVISEYAKNCKYSDCTHINEKGCAVITAFEKREIDAVVYNSYLKLIKEQQHFDKSITEKKQEGKRFGKMAREAKQNRKKYKY